MSLRFTAYSNGGYAYMNGSDPIVVAFHASPAELETMLQYARTNGAIIEDLRSPELRKKTLAEVSNDQLLQAAREMPYGSFAERMASMAGRFPWADAKTRARALYRSGAATYEQFFSVCGEAFSPKLRSSNTWHMPKEPRIFPHMSIRQVENVVVVTKANKAVITITCVTVKEAETLAAALEFSVSITIS